MKFILNETKFLQTINNKLERNLFTKEIESDLRDISQSKILHLGNIQNFMSYLVFTQKNNRYYYEGLVYLLENTNMDQSEAISMMDEIMGEDEYLYIEVLTYFSPDVMNRKNGEVA